MASSFQSLCSESRFLQIGYEGIVHNNSIQNSCTLVLYFLKVFHAYNCLHGYTLKDNLTNS